MKTTFEDAYLYLLTHYCIKPVGSLKCFWLFPCIPSRIHCFCWIFRMNFISLAFLKILLSCLINRYSRAFSLIFSDQLISFKYYLVYIYLHFCFGFAKTNPTKGFVVTLYPGVHLVRNKSPIIGKVLPENVQCHF